MGIRTVSWLVATLCFSAAFASGQETNQLIAERIKRNPSYLSAEASAPQCSTAQAAADKELLSQIYTFIKIETRTDREEKSSDTAYSLKSEYQSRSTSLTLGVWKGLKHYPWRAGKLWTVLSCLHKDSLKASIEYRKNRLRDYYALGLAAAAAQNLEVCLRNFYWGYLLAQYFPDTLRLILPDGSECCQPKDAFSKLIEDVVNDLVITAEPCYLEDSLALAPLWFTFRGEPVQKLSFRYYGGSKGDEYDNVDNEGFTSLRFFGKQVARSRQIYIRVDYKDETAMEREAEILALNELAPAEPFDCKKTVMLEFPWVRDREEELPQKPVEPAGQPEISFHETPSTQAHPASSQFAKVLEFFSAGMSYAHLEKCLSQYVEMGIIQVGKELANTRGSYVIVLDNAGTLDLFRFDGSQYTSLQTGNTLCDPGDVYPEANLVWFKENK